MAEKLVGTIERVTFHNQDNGYAVLKVRADGMRDLVTVVGHLSSVVAGEYFDAEGDWTHDRDHGPQFKATTLRTTPPQTTAGLVKYLGSGLIKGIGPTYAKRIVETFGDKTLEIIDRSPSFLGDVKGIGPQRLQRIRKSWEEQRGVRAIMVFLQSYGIGTARAVRIHKTYGDQAIDIVKGNPYRLTTDIYGVGFKTADELAMRLGLPAHSGLRARAAVRYVLQELEGQGHVAYPEVGVIEQTIALTEIPEPIIVEAIEQGRTEDEFIRDVPTDTPEGFPEGPWLYRKALFLAETAVARSVELLQRGEHPLRNVDVASATAWVETQMKLELAPPQRMAIGAALTEKMLIITGGPGVGKTTIVRGILDILHAKKLRVVLAAPTGRAAKRLAESTGCEAKTIHRLLEFEPALGRFQRNRENPLDADVVILDEASMIDLPLAAQLLAAVPVWAAVIFVGDVDQLPSVGPGSVLGDLIGSGVVKVVRLTEIFRQAGQSGIVRAAHAVHEGIVPESVGGDFFVLNVQEPAAAIDRILTMLRERIPAKFGLDPVRDVQILAPMNKSELGVRNLNLRLQEALNPPTANKEQVERYGTIFRVGDKVLQTRNDYPKETFNGDIGRIAAIDAEEQEMIVEFDGRMVPYEYGELDELTLAYAVSIHKSQGSEYPAVIVPLHTQHFVMLQRNLLYTALTRGRKLVAIVGNAKALEIAVQRQDGARRFGMLQTRLRQRREPG